MLEAQGKKIGRLLDALPEDTFNIFIGDNCPPNQVTRGLFGDHAANGTI